jgi:hypothetical protein
MIGSEYLVGGAFIGTLAALWTKIKNIFVRIKNLCLCNIIISNKDLRLLVLTYLYNQFKCGKFTSYTFVGKSEYIRKLERNRLVAYELLPKETTIWRKGWKILLTKPMDTSYNLYSPFSITFIRGTFNVDSFIEDAIKTSLLFLENPKIDRFYIIKMAGSIGSRDPGEPRPSDEKVESRGATEETPVHSKYDARPVCWEREELGIPKKKEPINFLSLSSDKLSAIDEARKWKNSEKWFKSKGVPWKRGWLLWGKPGTGKTAFTRALAQDLNIPIISFDLSTMNNNDFRKCWDESMRYLPAIFLFEDIDAIFEGRKNISCSKMNQGLSFDCFLNTLDGIESTEGVFIIVTTNNIDAIDPALGNPLNGISTRPGRIDKLLHFDILDEEGREKMARRVFDGVNREKWKHILEEGKNDTGAQFQGRCSKLALQLWEEVL